MDFVAFASAPSRLIVSIIIAAGFPLVLTAAELNEDFRDGLDQSRWCACQLDPAQLSNVVQKDADEPGDSIAAISVDKLSMGDRACTQACFAPGLAASTEETVTPDAQLGPSLVLSVETDWSAEERPPNPY